jgi:hypothetical protein
MYGRNNEHKKRNKYTKRIAIIEPNSDDCTEYDLFLGHIESAVGNRKEKLNHYEKLKNPTSFIVDKIIESINDYKCIVKVNKGSEEDVNLFKIEIDNIKYCFDNQGDDVKIKNKLKELDADRIECILTKLLNDLNTGFSSRKLNILIPKLNKNEHGNNEHNKVWVVQYESDRIHSYSNIKFSFDKNYKEFLKTKRTKKDIDNDNNNNEMSKSITLYKNIVDNMIDEFLKDKISADQCQSVIDYLFNQIKIYIDNKINKESYFGLDNKISVVLQSVITDGIDIMLELCKQDYNKSLDILAQEIQERKLKNQVDSQISRYNDFIDKLKNDNHKKFFKDLVNKFSTNSNDEQVSNTLSTAEQLGAKFFNEQDNLSRQIFKIHDALNANIDKIDNYLNLNFSTDNKTGTCGNEKIDLLKSGLKLIDPEKPVLNRESLQNIVNSINELINSLNNEQDKYLYDFFYNRQESLEENKNNVSLPDIEFDLNESIKPSDEEMYKKYLSDLLLGKKIEELENDLYSLNSVFKIKQKNYYTSRDEYFKSLKIDYTERLAKIPNLTLLCQKPERGIEQETEQSDSEDTENRFSTENDDVIFELDIDNSKAIKENTLIKKEEISKSASLLVDNEKDEQPKKSVFELKQECLDYESQMRNKASEILTLKEEVIIDNLKRQELVQIAITYFKTIQDFLNIIINNPFINKQLTLHPYIHESSDYVVFKNAYREYFPLNNFFKNDDHQEEKSYIEQLSDNLKKLQNNFNRLKSNEYLSPSDISEIFSDIESDYTAIKLTYTDRIKPCLDNLMIVNKRANFSEDFLIKIFEFQDEISKFKNEIDSTTLDDQLINSFKDKPVALNQSISDCYSSLDNKINEMLISYERDLEENKLISNEEFELKYNNILKNIQDTYNNKISEYYNTKKKIDDDNKEINEKLDILNKDLESTNTNHLNIIQAIIDNGFDKNLEFFNSTENLDHIKNDKGYISDFNTAKTAINNIKTNITNITEGINDLDRKIKDWETNSNLNPENFEAEFSGMGEKIETLNTSINNLDESYNNFIHSESRNRFCDDHNNLLNSTEQLLDVKVYTDLNTRADIWKDKTREPESNERVSGHIPGGYSLGGGVVTLGVAMGGAGIACSFTGVGLVVGIPLMVLGTIITLIGEGFLWYNKITSKRKDKQDKQNSLSPGKITHDKQQSQTAKQTQLRRTGKQKLSNISTTGSRLEVLSRQQSVKIMPDYTTDETVLMGTIGKKDSKLVPDNNQEGKTSQQQTPQKSDNDQGIYLKKPSLT